MIHVSALHLVGYTFPWYESRECPLICSQWGAKSVPSHDLAGPFLPQSRGDRSPLHPLLSEGEPHQKNSEKTCRVWGVQGLVDGYLEEAAFCVEVFAIQVSIAASQHENLSVSPSRTLPRLFVRTKCGRSTPSSGSTPLVSTQALVSTWVDT